MNTPDKSSIEYASPHEALIDHGMYVFMDPVSNDTVRPIIEWILHENYVRKKKYKELLLMICSNGGSMEDAFALIDVMASSKIAIKTVGLGSIASSALMIFLAGTRGRRVLTPNTSILSHQFAWGTSGKVHELFATVKEFQLSEQRMIQHYQNSTGLTEDRIRELLLPAQDVYLSAQEALDLGICDQIADLHS